MPCRGSVSSASPGGCNAKRSVVTVKKNGAPEDPAPLPSNCYARVDLTLAAPPEPGKPTQTDQPESKKQERGRFRDFRRHAHESVEPIVGIVEVTVADVAGWTVGV